MDIETMLSARKARKLGGSMWNRPPVRPRADLRPKDGAK